MLDKIVKVILTFLASNQFGAFMRTTINGFLSVLIVYLSWMEYSYIPFLVAILNLVTKEINKNFNPYYKNR